jgi:NADPH:quinone reductase-like Zn-dependent oxidoreductase
VSQRVTFFMASINSDDLTVLKDLIEANEVTPVVDRCYTMSEAPEALRYLKEGHARGKVVVTIA